LTKFQFTDIKAEYLKKCWIYLKTSQIEDSSQREKKNEKSLKTAQFQSNPTPGYQGYPTRYQISRPLSTPWKAACCRNKRNLDKIAEIS